MPHIQQLDAHVADLIAAGEVVERPASVVKELVENAIDAGAKAVIVEIQRGGMSYIRVTDNGCGIAPEEVETAFLRHATSKLRREEDLAAIGTLGFRGEALAAICAVSRVEVITRTPQCECGTAHTLVGGVPGRREECGGPVGTTMIVRDLFFNTPARLKFMKKDMAEGAAVFAAVQNAALSHPEVSFRFLRDGREDLITPGDGQLRSAIYAVLGREVALGLIPAKGGGEEIGVEGFVSLPTCCRGTRGYQHFFVNGRYVKSRTMTAALEEAYQNQKMVGKFPGCVLHVTVNPNAVDVNVHPTKIEVKFQSEKQLFDAVYHTVLTALEGDHTRPELAVKAQPPRPAPRDTVAPNQTCFKTDSLRGGSHPLHDNLRPMAPISLPSSASSVLAGMAGQPRQDRLAPDVGAHRPFGLGEPTRPKSPPQPPAPSCPPAPPPEEAVVSPDCPGWRVAGEVLNTYIIVEQGDTVLLIDKHAAHERMNFDRYKAQGYRPMGQRLLAPLVFTPPGEEGVELLSHLPLLEEFGFEVEEFGGGAVLVRQVPYDIPAEETEPTLTQLAQRLLRHGGADPDAARDDMLHTMACKAAIKGGQKNSPQELEKVAAAVMSGAVKYCPHGRPVAIELTRNELEKQFKRA